MRGAVSVSRSIAAARDGEVDEVAHLEQVSDGFAVGRRHELDRVAGEAERFE